MARSIYEITESGGVKKRKGIKRKLGIMESRLGIDSGRGPVQVVSPDRVTFRNNCQLVRRI